jgi:hypothetical protein
MSHRLAARLDGLHAELQVPMYVQRIAHLILLVSRGSAMLRQLSALLAGVCFPRRSGARLNAGLEPGWARYVQLGGQQKQLEPSTAHDHGVREVLDARPSLEGDGRESDQIARAICCSLQRPAHASAPALTSAYPP